MSMNIGSQFKYSNTKTRPLAKLSGDLYLSRKVHVNSTGAKKNAGTKQMKMENEIVVRREKCRDPLSLNHHPRSIFVAAAKESLKIQNITTLDARLHQNNHKKGVQKKRNDHARPNKHKYTKPEMSQALES